MTGPLIGRRGVLGLLAAGAGLPLLAASRSDLAGLLADMTLAEKLGQLTMVTAGYTVTGPTGVEDIPALVRAGREACDKSESIVPWFWHGSALALLPWLHTRFAVLAGGIGAPNHAAPGDSRWVAAPGSALR